MIAGVAVTVAGLELVMVRRVASLELTDGKGLTAGLGDDGVVRLGGQALFEVAFVEQAGEAQTRGETVHTTGRHQRTWGAFVEVLEPLASGFEHSFLVNQRPRGPLTVTLRPEGLAAFRTDRLTFNGSVPFEARAPVWVDADGRRTELLYEQHGALVRVSVPETVLERSRFPAVLDPWLGPAQPVDAPVIGHAFGMQAFTKMARGGDGRSLLVWVDGRSGRDFDLFGTLLSPSGQVLQPLGFPIIAMRGDQYEPAVVSDGTQYYVAFVDTRRATLQVGSTDIRVIRISEDGVVLDPGGVPLVEIQDFLPRRLWYLSAPDLQVHSGVLGLAWEEVEALRPTVPPPLPLRERYSCRAQTFDAVTLEARSSPVELTLRYWPEFNWGDVAILQAPSGFDIYWGLEDWYEDGGLTTGSFRRFIDFDGGVTPSEQLRTEVLTPPTLVQPVNFSSGLPALVWPELRVSERDGGPLSIAEFTYQARLKFLPRGLDGGAVGLPSYTLFESPSGLSIDAVTASPDGLLASVLDYRRNLESDLSLLRIVEDAGALRAKLEPVAFLPNWQGTSSVLPLADGGAVMAWADLREEPYNQGLATSLSDVYVTTVSAGGSVSPKDGALVTLAPNSQRRPSIASRAEGSLVVWEDSRAGVTDVYAMRLGPDGTRLDDAGVPIANRPRAEASPTVAAGPNGYLVVWEDTTETVTADLWVRRFDVNGVAMGPGRPLVTSQHSQRRPHLAANGSGYCLVWEDGRETFDFGTRIYGAFLDANGTITPEAGKPMAPRPPSNQDSSQTSPRCDWDGTSWRVGYLDDRRGLPTLESTDIYLRSFSPEGLSQGDELLVSSTLGTAREFTLASSGDVALVAWTDLRVESETVVYAAISVANRVVKQDLRFASAGSQEIQQRPVALALGDRFLVAFEQRPTPDASDLVGVLVGADGFIEPERVELASGAAEESFPALSRALLGRVTAAWVQLSVDPRLRVERVFTRTLRTSKNGTRCDAKSECESDFCVEGVCCTSACEGGISQCQSCLSGSAGPGTCSVVPRGTRCGEVNACGEAPVCDGQNASCPTDEVVCQAPAPLPLVREPLPGACGCSGGPSSLLLPAVVLALWCVFRRRVHTPRGEGQVELATSGVSPHASAVAPRR